MMEVLASWPPVLQALAASMFTWGVTAAWRSAFAVMMELDVALG